MKLAAAVLSISLAPVTLFAQTTAPNPILPAQATATYHMTPSSNTSGCPVSLRAQQVSSVDMVPVQQHQNPGQNREFSPMGQRLHLSLTNPDAKAIVAATVTVRGYTYKPQVMNTVARRGPGEPSIASRTISVTFLPGSGKAVAADIVVPDVTAAQTIDLTSLTYADGSGWKLADGASCRIAPDPLMLVSAR
jgi:hypothetical protein